MIGIDWLILLNLLLGYTVLAMSFCLLPLGKKGLDHWVAAMLWPKIVLDVLIELLIETKEAFK